MSSERREAQRTRVRDVASGLFAEHGFDDVTMADIANAAGVARATVFNYFGSKHALVEEITESVFEFYVAMLDAALADDVTPTPELVRRLFAEMGAGIETARGFFRGVFREIAKIQLGLDEGSVAQRASDDAKERTLTLLRRGQERGDISADIDARDLTEAMTSLSNGTITSWLYTDVSQSLVARMEAAADVLLSAVEQKGERR
jgi:AcrR family transcriptional regulator